MSIQSISELIELCRQAGGADFTIGDVFFKETEVCGIGIFTNSKIEKLTSAIVSVPFRSCISVNLIKQSPPLDVLFVENPGYLSYPDEVLSIGLIYARLRSRIGENTSCTWQRHVSTMPESFNTPLFWSEKELDELKGCTVFHLTKLLKRQIESDYQALYEPLISNYPEHFTSMTINDYYWALSVVYSRSAEIIRQGSLVRCIPPILDMANHNPQLSAEPSETLYYDEATDCLQLRAAQILNPQDECTAVYGNYPNSKLLYTYGFVVHDNPHKAIDLWTKVTPTVYQAEVKQQILLCHSLTAVQTYDFVGTIRTGFVSPALLATIRVIQATEDEMKDIEKAFIGEMISIRNEMATYTSLRSLLIFRMNAARAEVKMNI